MCVYKNYVDTYPMLLTDSKLVSKGNAIITRKQRLWWHCVKFCPLYEK